MKYGFCKEFSTPMKTEVDYELIRLIKEAGFDFVEMRAMLVASLSDEDFEKLCGTLSELDLGCECSCALFPKTLRVTGSTVDYKAVADYLELAFSRLKRLGAKKVVFGSAPARVLDEETTQDMGYEQISKLCREVVVPAAEKYDITVVIEPLRAAACNFINTLSDGMRVVETVGHPRIALLADTIHMMSNNDDPDDVVRFRDSLKHVHIAELERMLPEDGYSEFVKKVIGNLVNIGYEGTISFETKNGEGLSSMKKALSLLKSSLGK